LDLFWRGGGSPPAEHIRHDDLTTRGEKNLSDTKIYARDIRGLNESDAIIAEASAMLSGNPLMTVVRYNDLHEAQAAIDVFIASR